MQFFHFSVVHNVTNYENNFLKLYCSYNSKKIYSSDKWNIFWELILPSRQMCGLLQKGFVLVLLHKSNKHYVVDGFMVGNWGILLLKCAFPSLFWAHKRRSVVAESISPFWTLPVVLHDSQGEVSREAVSIPGHGVCSIFRDKSMPYNNI